MARQAAVEIPAVGETVEVAGVAFEIRQVFAGRKSQSRTLYLRRVDRRDRYTWIGYQKPNGTVSIPNAFGTQPR